MIHARHEHDWYVEPPECVEKLIKAEQSFGRSILDPCCGQGTIPITLLDYGFNNIDAADLVDRGIKHSELKSRFKQQDFLAMPEHQKWDSSIKNGTVLSATHRLRMR